MHMFLIILFAIVQNKFCSRRTFFLYGKQFTNFELNAWWSHGRYRTDYLTDPMTKCC